MGITKCMLTVANICLGPKTEYTQENSLLVKKLYVKRNVTTTRSWLQRVFNNLPYKLEKQYLKLPLIHYGIMQPQVERFRQRGPLAYQRTFSLLVIRKPLSMKKMAILSIYLFLFLFQCDSQYLGIKRKTPIIVQRFLAVKVDFAPLHYCLNLKPEILIKDILL